MDKYNNGVEWIIVKCSHTHADDTFDKGANAINLRRILFTERWLGDSSVITADGDCSHEIKKTLTPWKESYDQLSIFKSRDITLPTKVRLVRAMVFPVVVYACETWTVKRLSTEELMLLNCGVGEDSWESLGLQGDPTSPFWRRSALGFLWREWC